MHPEIDGGKNDGAIYNYDLQAWVRKEGTVIDCNHPAHMREKGYCCNAARFCGLTENEAFEMMEKE